MLDTNAINQAGEAVTAIHTQLQTNWPAICAAAVIVSRELRNFNQWLVSAAEYVIRHGGIAMIAKKLVYNPTTERTTL